MVKIDRIYTRQGDRGTTHLIGGAQADKHSLRVSAYGEIDELNSAIGACWTEARARTFDDWCADLQRIQNELFDLGAELAAPADQAAAHKLPMLGPEHTLALEQGIDALIDNLPALRSFVLPGGSLLNVELHRARTICRRAERSICELNAAEELRGEVLRYVNRLSDYLFAMARAASFRQGIAEQLWKPGGV